MTIAPNICAGGNGILVLVGPDVTLLRPVGGYAINYCAPSDPVPFDPSVGGIYQDDIHPGVMIRAWRESSARLSGFALGMAL